MVHNTYIIKNAAITIPIPTSLRRILEMRAETQHRSLSAQVVADLETSLERRDETAKKGLKHAKMLARQVTKNQVGDRR